MSQDKGYAKIKAREAVIDRGFVVAVLILFALAFWAVFWVILS